MKQEIKYTHKNKSVLFSSISIPIVNNPTPAPAIKIFLIFTSSNYLSSGIKTLSNIRFPFSSFI